MKKILTILLLFMCLAVKAQQNYYMPGVPPSTVGYSPTFRAGTITPDSINNFWMAYSNKWYRINTAVQSLKINDARYPLLAGSNTFTGPMYVKSNAVRGFFKVGNDTHNISYFQDSGGSSELTSWQFRALNDSLTFRYQPAVFGNDRFGVVSGAGAQTIAYLSDISGGVTTLYSLTNGLGIKPFTFNGGTSGVTVKLDTGFTSARARFIADSIKLTTNPDNPALLKYNYIGGNVKTMMKAAASGWDQALGEFGNVVKYNGKLYQFYTGYIRPETETNVNIGLAVSSDGGKTWVKGGTLGDGQITTRPMEDPYCVFDVPTNTAYLFAEDKMDVPFRNIRMFTSALTDLVNWTDRGDVLDIGATGSWEATDVSSPTVVIKDRKFYLVYEGRAPSQGGAIGLATAPISLTPTFTKFAGNPTIGGSDSAPFSPGSQIAWSTDAVPDDIVQNNGKYYITFHASNQVFGPSTAGQFEEGIAVADSSMTNMKDNLGSWLSTSNYTDYNGKGVDLSLDSGEYKVYYVDTLNNVVKRAQLIVQTTADFRNKDGSFGSIYTRYLMQDTTTASQIKFRNPTTRREVTRSINSNDVKNIWGPVFVNTDPGYVGDFNNVINTQPGYPKYLMLGTATNAPPSSSGSFFYVSNTELGATKDGTHNLIQYADSYGNSGNKRFYRTRVSGTWSSWFEMIDNSSTQTLAGKTLTSPKLNASNAAGQIWTSDGANNGGGVWATPSNVFNDVIFNNSQSALNTSDQRPHLFSTSGTGTGRFASAGNFGIQGRPNDLLGVSIFTGATPVERVRVENATTTITNSPRLSAIASGTAGTDSLLVKNASTNVVSKIAANYYTTNPMTTIGDIIYGGASGVPTRLAAGSTGTVLHGGGAAAPGFGQVVGGDIAGLTITYSKIQAGTTNRLYGTGSGTTFAEITPGTGLSFSGTTLNATGTLVHSIFTPTTGGTVTLVNNQYNIINPAGALVALTVTLPSSPANNDKVQIKFTQAITTVTYSGGTVADGITSPVAGGYVILVYDSTNNTWY